MKKQKVVKENYCLNWFFYAMNDRESRNKWKIMTSMSKNTSVKR